MRVCQRQRRLIKIFPPIISLQLVKLGTSYFVCWFTSTGACTIYYPQKGCVQCDLFKFWEISDNWLIELRFANGYNASRTVPRVLSEHNQPTHALRPFYKAYIGYQWISVLCSNCVCWCLTSSTVLPRHICATFVPMNNCAQQAVETSLYQEGEPALLTVRSWLLGPVLGTSYRQTSEQ